MREVVAVIVLMRYRHPYPPHSFHSGVFTMNRIRLVWAVALPVAALLVVLSTGAIAQPKKEKGVWSDPADSTLPPDFKVQGEYVGEIKEGEKVGCQVIALGGGAFQAVVYPG